MWPTSSDSWAKGEHALSKQDLTLVSTRIYAKDRPFSGYLTVSDGQIVSMGSGRPTDADTQVIDVGDSRVIPGLIDIHSHGFIGLDMGSGTEEEVRKIAKALAERGRCGPYCRQRP